jgi:hypothetical protein
VSRCFALMIGVLAGLAPVLVPVLAHAQVSIDQGKSPADLFANDCATCHKGARGLANGRGSSELASFLVEHYTSSKDEAAALAAYVMSSGGGDRAPAAQGRGAKPEAQPTRAAVEEPKPVESKPGAKPSRESGKPEEHNPASARLQPPAEEQKKPGDIPSIMHEPESRQPVTIRGRRKEKEPAAAPSQPAPVATESPPAPTLEPTHAAPPPPPAQEASPSAAPANAASGEGEPAPRDNIPD